MLYNTPNLVGLEKAAFARVVPVLAKGLGKGLVNLGRGARVAGKAIAKDVRPGVSKATNYVKGALKNPFNQGMLTYAASDALMNSLYPGDNTPEPEQSPAQPDMLPEPIYPGQPMAYPSIPQQMPSQPYNPYMQPIVSQPVQRPVAPQPAPPTTQPASRNPLVSPIFNPIVHGLR